MNIKEKVADIRKEITDEEVTRKVNPILEQILTTHFGTKDELEAVRSEAIEKRQKLTTANGEIIDLKSQIEKLGDDTRVKELENENTNLKTFQKQIFKEKKVTLANKVKTYEKHENFGKVKGNLGLATKTEKDADGKDQIVVDVDSMDDSAVNNSLGKFIEYESIEIFGKTDPNGNGDPTNSNANTQVKVNLADPNKIDRIDQAKNHPKEYAQWVKEGRP